MPAFTNGLNCIGLRHAAHITTGRIGPPLLCGLLLCSSPPTLGETVGPDPAHTPPSLETVVVTGSRLQQTLTEVGSSVTLLSAEDLDRIGAPFLADALATAPGVTVNQTGAFGGLAAVRIRGASQAQTLVLVDGVPVNDVAAPGGGFDFARLDPSNIERVEILRGPQSTLWGTDAIAGVTAITTRRPETGLGGSLFAEYGSFQTLRGGAAVDAGNDRADLRLALTTIDSDGISKADENNGNSEEDSYKATTLSARGGVELGAGARLELSVLWNEADTEFDSFDFTAQGSIGDGDQSTDSEELASNLALTLPVLDGRFENLLLLGYSDLARTNFTDGEESFAATGERSLFRYQGTFRVDDRNTLAFGLEREATEAGDDDTNINSLFALYELQPLDALTLTAGVRNDDHDAFGNETTARLALAWALSDNLLLRSSWGQGFKAPTLFQTTFFCCGAPAANPDVVAETSESFDIGLDWRSADTGAVLSATVFQQDTDNEIIFDFFLGGYDNRDELQARGLELSAGLPLGAAMSLKASYSWIDAEDGAGNGVFRLPEHAGTLTLSYDRGGPLSAAVLLRHNGSELNTDGSTLDAWTRVDLTARYALTDRLELYGRVENLADADYQQVIGFGTPGRSGSLGIRLRY